MLEKECVCARLCECNSDLIMCARLPVWMQSYNHQKHIIDCPHRITEFCCDSCAHQMRKYSRSKSLQRIEIARNDMQVFPSARLNSHCSGSCSSNVTDVSKRIRQHTYVNCTASILNECILSFLTAGVSVARDNIRDGNNNRWNECDKV